MAALGLGVAHDGAAPTVESLTAALGTALEPEVRAQATAMATDARGDGAARAAELLLAGLS